MRYYGRRCPGPGVRPKFPERPRSFATGRDPAAPNNNAADRLVSPTGAAFSPPGPQTRAAKVADVVALGVSRRRAYDQRRPCRAIYVPWSP
jgi:hypothetical protein